MMSKQFCLLSLILHFVEHLFLTLPITSRGRGARSLGEYFPDDPGLLDACESLIKALEPERQPAVVDAEAV